MSTDDNTEPQAAPAAVGPRFDGGVGRLGPERDDGGTRWLLHCHQCYSAILPTDDASVCVQCGGRSVRAYPRHCCPQCGKVLGYLGRAMEWLFGRKHECNDRAVLIARFVRCSTGGKDLVRHKTPNVRGNAGQAACTEDADADE